MVYLLLHIFISLKMSMSQLKREPTIVFLYIINMSFLYPFLRMYYLSIFSVFIYSLFSVISFGTYSIISIVQTMSFFSFCSMKLNVHHKIAGFMIYVTLKLNVSSKLRRKIIWQTTNFRVVYDMFYFEILCNYLNERRGAHLIF